jgi:hypothetical protein
LIPSVNQIMLFSLQEMQLAAAAEPVLDPLSAARR